MRAVIEEKKRPSTQASEHRHTWHPSWIQSWPIQSHQGSRHSCPGTPGNIDCLLPGTATQLPTTAHPAPPQEKNQQVHLNPFFTTRTSEPSALIRSQQTESLWGPSTVNLKRICSLQISKQMQHEPTLKLMTWLKLITIFIRIYEYLDMENEQLIRTVMPRHSRCNHWLIDSTSGPRWCCRRISLCICPQTQIAGKKKKKPKQSLVVIFLFHPTKRKKKVKGKFTQITYIFFYHNRNS